MNRKSEILKELEAIAPALIPLQGQQVFFAPEGYFETFSTEVSMRLAYETSKVLPMPSTTLSIPEGFFDGFANSVLQRIKMADVSAASEIKGLSPALAATGNDNIFKVPATYFRDLPDMVLSKVQKPAKVISMKPKSFFARYAAAAVITGILGLSTFSLFNSRDEVESVNTTAIAMADAQQIIQTNSFDRLMETVSDEEIVGFLRSEGQDVKAALVASSIDSKELPAAEEYILNENTLDNYLESLDITYPN